MELILTDEDITEIEDNLPYLNDTSYALHTLDIFLKRYKEAKS